MSFELSKILQYFSNTEGRIFQFETLKSGHINDTFLVKPADSRGASFILQQLNTAIFDRPESIARNVELVANHLKSKGYAKQILQFCRTTDGQFFYQNAENACWRLMPFIENAFSILRSSCFDLRDHVSN